MTTTAPSSFSTLKELFDRSAALHSERPLFGVKVDGDWRWSTYSDFAAQVMKLRSGLYAAGVRKGDRVAVISGNRPEWAAAGYAAWTLGAVYVPMYESQDAKEREYILRDSGAETLFVSTVKIYRQVLEMRESLPKLRNIYVFGDLGSGYVDSSFSALLEHGKASSAPDITIVPDDLAALIYTAGTTGEPKGVMLSHGNIASNVAATSGLFPLGPEDRCLSFLPWAHVFGQTAELHTFISLGGSIAICEGIEKIVPNLGEVRPTVLCAVPRIFQRIHDGVRKQVAGKPKLIQRLFERGLAGPGFARALADLLIFRKVRKKFGGRLRFAISGGAELKKAIAEFIDGVGIEVYEGYGLTETSPVVSVTSPGKRKFGTVGLPIPGVTVEIDTTASDIPMDGEIIIHGPNVMHGYYNKPNETAQVMTDRGGFRSGDLGCFDEDGYLKITGRIKEIEKLTNGKYVAVSALQEQLKLSPYIANVYLEAANRDYVTALIVPTPEASNGLNLGHDNDFVRPNLRSELDRLSADWKPYERVMEFAIVTEDFTQENGMLTPKLSLKRREVLKKYGDLIESMYKK